MNSVISETITFKEIERTIFEIGCEIAKNFLKQCLETRDKEISETRNKAELRHKGCRETVIKTLMGEVILRRTLYKRVADDGSNEYVFLLDEELGFDTIGNISPNLAEKIAGQACEMSFREVSGSVSGLTNQSISHQGVWNVVQAIGEKQADAEKRLADDFENDRLSGDKKVEVLFEEADGLWLSMQKRNRKNHKKIKKELKTGVVYEGWEKRYPSSKEYRTVEKAAYAGFMGSEDFKVLRDCNIALKYDMDEITHRILNGDGASWIRKDHDTETDIVQLDRFHLSKSIARNVSDKKAGRYIADVLKTGQCEKALEKIEELKYECGGEEDKVRKLRILESYIKNNADSVMVYRDRAGLDLPEAPEGIEYRTLGTMERNVGIFAKRMKGAKSWSEKGASNLAKIIALKMGKGFNNRIEALLSGNVSERLSERFDEVIWNTRKTLGEKVSRSVYPLHHGEIPFSHCSVTNGRKAIRSMFDLKPFSEMEYR
jgi:hypothetical protein